MNRTAKKEYSTTNSQNKVETLFFTQNSKIKIQDGIAQSNCVIKFALTERRTEIFSLNWNQQHKMQQTKFQICKKEVKFLYKTRGKSTQIRVRVLLC